MKVLVKKSVILELDATEAEWLRGLMQNSMCPPDEEPEVDKDIRGRFWKALNRDASNRECVITSGLDLD